MTAKIIDGVAIARKVRVGDRGRARRGAAATGFVSALTMIIVGDNPASAVYVRNKVGLRRSRNPFAGSAFAGETSEAICSIASASSM
jgi:methylenetetrahydrofolate dehydrogenase (NADP+)/methenyltetrahydrofolate cyclohydrolase